MDPLISQILKGETPGIAEFVDGWGGHFPLLLQLAQTPQDPLWHAEGNVFIHTGMVLDELYARLEAEPVAPATRLVLVLAALFHDIAKPLTTTHKVIDGVERISSPRHADVGRSYLAYTIGALGLDWAVVDQVLALVGHHHDPKQLVTRDASAAQYRRLARLCDPRLLYTLEQADVRGRTCDDKQEQIDYIDLFRHYADDFGCFHDSPHDELSSYFEHELVDWPEITRRFVMAQAVRNLESGVISTHHEELARSYGYRDDYSHLVVLCGPSGSGKSTWVKENLPDYDRVELDALRQELTGDAADQSANGEVRQLSKEKLKVSLRAKRNVVWDATNLRRDFRRLPIELGFDYNAFVTLVVFQSTLKQLQGRNRERQRQVAPHVLQRQIERAQFPYADEAHEVVLVRE